MACAVLTPSLLPALALMADLPRWNDVFPFNACGAVGIFAWNIAASFQIHPVAGVLAAAIELGGLWGVELPGDFLGFAESSGRLGVSVDGKKQATHRDKTDTH